jgi:hypothetical protein
MQIDVTNVHLDLGAGRRGHRHGAVRDARGRARPRLAGARTHRPRRTRAHDPVVRGDAPRGRPRPVPRRDHGGDVVAGGPGRGHRPRRPVPARARWGPFAGDRDGQRPVAGAPGPRASARRAVGRRAHRHEHARHHAVRQRARDAPRRAARTRPRRPDGPRRGRPGGATGGRRRVRRAIGRPGGDPPGARARRAGLHHVRDRRPGGRGVRARGDRPRDPRDRRPAPLVRPRRRRSRGRAPASERRSRAGCRSGSRTSCASSRRAAVGCVASRWSS